MTSSDDSLAADYRAARTNAAIALANQDMANRIFKLAKRNAWVAVLNVAVAFFNIGCMLWWMASHK